MVRVGIAGIGFMGWIHYLAYQHVSGAKLTAFCSRSDKKRAGDWRDIQGNFGPAGEQIDVSEFTAYSSYEALLNDPDIDLVDLCLPPDQHADATIAALQAGKHVLVEKPMALTTDQCEQMVAVAQDVGKQVFVAHVLPFFPEYAHARAVIAGGEYGQLIGGNFKRVISDPLWLEDFYDPQRVGGPLVDLHVHDAHLIRMLFGMPSAVTSTGRIRGEVVEYCDTLFHFDDDPSLVVRATGGVINQQGRPFTHGFEIHLERASLHYELGAFADEVEVMPLKILTDAGEVVRPELTAGGEIPAFTAEIEEVVRALQQNEPSEILSGELAGDAIRLCYRQTESVKSNTRVKV